MNNTARQNILAKLRAAGTAAPVTTAANYAWPAIPHPREHFCTLLRANHAQVIEIDDEDPAPAIAGILQQSGFNEVVASEKVRQLYPSLQALSKTLPKGDIGNWKNYLFNEVEVGITNAEGAIATTGTLILNPGADEPRSLSLVPPCHIVIVREAVLYNDFASAVHQGNWKDNMPTNRLLVSGPSKTADIQQTLAYGAHGPRELFVILIREPSVPAPAQ